MIKRQMIQCYSQNVTSNIFFFFNDTATTEIYTLSLHDALPISTKIRVNATCRKCPHKVHRMEMKTAISMRCTLCRSEERFSRNAETDLVCRLLLEKKKELTLCTYLQALRLGHEPVRRIDDDAVA